MEFESQLKVLQLLPSPTISLVLHNEGSSAALRISRFSDAHMESIMMFQKILKIKKSTVIQSHSIKGVLRIVTIPVEVIVATIHHIAT